MSYEPTIYIKKTDLDANYKQIQSEFYDLQSKVLYGGKATTADERFYEIFEILYNCLNERESTVIKFPELEIVVVKVELTKRNEEFRSLLGEFNINYQVTN